MPANLIILIIITVALNIGCVASILRCQYDSDRNHDYAATGFTLLAIVTGVGAAFTVVALIVSLVPSIA